MASQTGSFELSSVLAERGIDLAALGGAYLILIATAGLTMAAFYAARSQLVVSPNRGSRDYGIYVSLTLAALLIAIVLENESLPSGSATLHYVLMPQLVALMGLHLSIWYSQEPWLVTLGAAATAATVAVGTLLGLTSDLLGPAYWVALLALGALLAFLWWKAVSTQRAFVNASSIYMISKETSGTATAPQTPWLGLTQWVALIVGESRARRRQLVVARPCARGDAGARGGRRIGVSARRDGARLRRAGRHAIGSRAKRGCPSSRASSGSPGSSSASR